MQAVAAHGSFVICQLQFSSLMSEQMGFTAGKWYDVNSDQPHVSRTVEREATSITSPQWIRCRIISWDANLKLTNMLPEDTANPNTYTTINGRSLVAHSSPLADVG